MWNAVYIHRLKRVKTNEFQSMGYYCLSKIGASYLIGRQKSCSIQINEEIVSGEHAEIVYSVFGPLKIQDLGSSNGTYLGGSQLSPKTKYALNEGNRFCLGHPSSPDAIFFLVSSHKDLNEYKKEEATRMVQPSGLVQKVNNFYSCLFRGNIQIGEGVQNNDDVSSFENKPSLEECDATNDGTGKGRYRLVKLLEDGEGGMGKVRLFLDRTENRLVAGKTTTSEADVVKEATNLNKVCRHENIVQYLCMASFALEKCLIMEYLPGVTLQKYIQENQTSIRQKVTWAIQIADALDYCHAMNITHRDVKPLNIRLTDQGMVKLLDFGIAHDEKDELTKTVQLQGTPSYMSPEIYRLRYEKSRNENQEEKEKRRLTVYRKADDYAAGACFYYTLTGEPPLSTDEKSVAKTIKNYFSKPVKTQAYQRNRQSQVLGNINPYIKEVCLQQISLGKNRPDVHCFKERLQLWLLLESENVDWEKLAKDLLKENGFDLQSLDASLIEKTGFHGLQYPPPYWEAQIVHLPEDYAMLAQEARDQMDILWTPSSEAQKSRLISEVHPAMIWGEIPILRAKAIYGAGDKRLVSPEEMRQVQEMQKLQESLNEKTEEATVLSRQLTERTKIIQGLEQEKSRLEQKIEAIFRQLTEKTTKANDLTASVQALSTQLHGKTTEAGDLSMQLNEKTQAIEKLKQEKKQWEQKKKELEQTIVFIEKDADARRQKQAEAAQEAERKRKQAETEAAQEAERKRKQQAEAEATQKAEQKRFGIDVAIWNACQYPISQDDVAKAPKERQSDVQKFVGERILDMTTDVWCRLSWKEQQEYATAYQEEYAKAKGLPVEKTVDEGRANIVMRLIPPGRFWMGSPDGATVAGSGIEWKAESGRYDDEKLHRVILARPYYIGKYEVTQKQWEAVMKDKPSYFQHAGEDAPVEQVSWNRCQEFCKATGTKLPTEAQWEYACRSGVLGMSYQGDFEILGLNNAPKLDKIAWYGGNSGVEYEGGIDSTDWPEKQYDHKKAGTHPVGKKEPNSFGLYDMLGNVWELCQDSCEWKDMVVTESYIEGIVEPEYQKGSFCVYRGGSWRGGARFCRCAYRGLGSPGSAWSDVGLRVVSPEF